MLEPINRKAKPMSWSSSSGWTNYTYTPLELLRIQYFLFHQEHIKAGWTWPACNEKFVIHLNNWLGMTIEPRAPLKSTLPYGLIYLPIPGISRILLSKQQLYLVGSPLITFISLSPSWPHQNNLYKYNMISSASSSLNGKSPAWDAFKTQHNRQNMYLGNQLTMGVSPKASSQVDRVLDSRCRPRP